MSRPQPTSTFVAPPQANRPAAPKGAGDRKPFVIVPASMVIDDLEKLEHWSTAIDAATD
jgi:hypothetical protein